MTTRTRATIQDLRLVEAVYHRSDTAEAEPAGPGWRIPVNDLFPD